MVADNDGVWVAIDTAFYGDFNAHDPLHPETVDSHRSSVEAVRERGDGLGLKPGQWDQLEWRDEDKASQPNHQIAEKPDARQDA